jgi:3-phenylpropionate/cinnamic acid dioxygenase small subunit
MKLADRDLAYEVEQFLYQEAALLDSGKFHDWLDLFTDDARYWVPVRESVQGETESFPEEGSYAVNYMNDDKEFLTARIKRLDTGVAHAETPPSRTRHYVSNVQVQLEEDGSGEVTAFSNFIVYQGRRERSDYQFFGRREDRLRRVDGSWRIAHRRVYLQHAVLPRGVSIFF